ncbi:hypothetical protein OG594_44910 [Streptomyces sp. NBC_01214]|nr:hypothetical protein [Streptomyces sp. NBC_01214]MCX4808640.1 hypothetical protein [Streptomyces sp. NBC_01214]
MPDQRSVRLEHPQIDRTRRAAVFGAATADGLLRWIRACDARHR